ncbi:FAD-binding oxidoreductase [Bradyrhizobium sp. 61]|uniref:FAD-binding oxidoreductase n=1 Tax=unclassified Bradyrhizobium TaxID=2631580 RepID=UPI001FF72D79|nr:MULTISPECIES: FAD-binding oxidoreductase [unclassified Bradyrhizobium]MCK1281872.1 FAD-binding oxidoreductase [Bradyrhizobium sp. 61]MCK1459768.1 FAD-binding oxidoreductase [Bradyrhizobium sp. 2]
MTGDISDANRPIPLGLTGESLRVALAAIASAIGSEKLDTDDLADFQDPFQFPGSAVNVPSGVVSPTSVEDVQAIMRIANEHGVPLWPLGRGKNNGYGGAAPQVRGALMLSFRNMNKVLEINEKLGYAIVEPGVSWFDLYEAIEAGGHNLAASIVEIGWGGVVSNTLEHGQTYMPYSIDQASHCGFEVVLPNGDLLRTGSGAMENNPTWPLYKRGFGPTSTELFMQSNFGVVTKMGYWLMPKPEVYMPLWLQVWDDGQMPAVVDALRELMLAGTINMRPSMNNTLCIASKKSARTDWYDGIGPVPEEIIDKIAKALDVGRWMMRFALYGDEPIVDYNFAKLKKRFESIPSVRVTGKKHGADEFESLPSAVERVMIGVPSTDLNKMSGWSGGDAGGHVDFSPVIPLTGEHARAAQDLFTKMSAEAGFDYLVGIVPINARSAASVNIIPFDTTDEGQVQRAYAHAKRMVVAAGKLGYGAYRAHLSFMDPAADQFGFNDHAQRRFNETIKNALDPNGIIAPGKSGIWGSRFRKAGYPRPE